MLGRNRYGIHRTFWTVNTHVGSIGETVVNAVLGECIWNLAYDERRSAIVLELTVSLEEDAISDLCCQFPIPADYDGVGSRGTKFVFYI